MSQRWLKNMLTFAVSGFLLTSCQKNNYSSDLPLDPKYSPSLFIGSQNQFVYALNPATGTKKWEYNLYANLSATPVVFKNKYLILSKTDSLIVLDVNTGLRAGAISVPGLNADMTLLDVNEQYIIGANATSYFKADFPLSLSTGALAGSTVFFGTAPTGSSPTVYNNLLIYVDGTNLVAAPIASPTATAWTTPIGPATPISSPTVRAPYAYVGGIDGNLYVINLTNGSVAWTYTTGAPILSSPIVYGGNIIFGSSDYTLYCIDSLAKVPRWTVNTGDRIVSSPFAYNEVVYFASYDYYFYSVNIIDGSLKWKYKTGALIKSSPVAVDKTVYVGGFDKMLYAFDTSGSLTWSRNIDGLIETSPVLYDLNKAYYPSISGSSIY